MAAGNAKGVRAGKAYVEIGADPAKLEKGLKLAARKLRRWGARLTAVGAGVAASSTAIFAPLAAASIKAASDAEESTSRFFQVFGEEAEQARAAAERIGDDVGRSALDVMGAMGTYQSFFVGLGFGGSEAAKLSEHMAKLGLDFASFNNLSDAEGMQRFISALSGSSEVLDRFGINTKQAALEQELLAQGVNKAWSEVTEQEKALVRLEVITRAMTSQGAVGDAVRTAGHFANQMKRLGGEIKDTSVAIGQALLPGATAAAAKFGQLAGIASDWAKENPRLIRQVFQVGAAITAIGLAVAGLGVTITAAAFVFSTLASAVGIIITIGPAILSMLAPVGLALAAITGLTYAVVKLSDDGGAAFAGLGAKAGAVFDWIKAQGMSLREVFGETLGGIGDALKAKDLELAAQIGLGGVKAVFSGAAGFIKKVMVDASVSIIARFARMSAAIKDALADAFATFASSAKATNSVLKTLGTPESLRTGFVFGGILAGRAADGLRRSGGSDAANADAIESIGEVAKDGFAAEAAAARDELDRLRKEASEKAKARAGGSGPSSDLQGLIKRLSAGLGVAERGERFTARGTFSSAASGLGGSTGLAARALDAAKQTARNTKEIADEMRDGGAVYG